MFANTRNGIKVSHRTGSLISGSGNSESTLDYADEIDGVTALFKCKRQAQKSQGSEHLDGHCCFESLREPGT